MNLTRHDRALIRLKYQRAFKGKNKLVLSEVFAKEHGVLPQEILDAINNVHEDDVDVDIKFLSGDEVDGDYSTIAPTPEEESEDAASIGSSFIRCTSEHKMVRVLPLYSCVHS